jgi:hypothetical protein
LREEHRLRVFEYRVLRKIFGPKRDEWSFGFRKTLGSSWVAVQLVVSQVGLIPMSEWQFLHLRFYCFVYSSSHVFLQFCSLEF